MSSIPAVQWFARADRTLGSEPQALEVNVEVSGAHAAGGSGARQLFTEVTKTTLIFDDGAVVKLSAAVVVGQLLFLRHLESQKEIVTRVLRQRSFGTAIAYVELEFSEIVPDFWGQAAPGSESDTTDAALKFANAPLATTEPSGEIPHQSPTDRDRPSVAGAADDAHSLSHEQRPAHAAPVAVDAEEVARLRQELAGLRLQMSTMGQSGASATEEGTAAIEDASASVASKMLASKLKLPAPDFADPDSTTTQGESVAQFPPSPARGGVRVSIGLIAALLILGLVAASAYFNGFLKDRHPQRNVAAGGVSVSGSGHTPPTTTTHPAIAASAAGASSNHLENNGNASPGAQRSATGTVVSTADHNNPATIIAAADHHAAAPSPSQNPVPDSNRAKLQESAERALQGAESEGSHLAAVLRNSNNQPMTPVALKESEESYEPPSLIKAVNAVPPAAATRGFVTGDVKFDAVIDATGRVESAKVLSGPEPLRAAALEALKHYQYKPATKNGQSVAARLPVTVKFWYEP